MDKIFDSIKGCYVEMPEEMKAFIEEIDSVCKKHNLSISHEDRHGKFLIERYDKYYIDWLYEASKCYEDTD